MLPDCRELVRELGIASTLDEALGSLVRRINDLLPVDACAVYLEDSEAGQYVLKASSSAQPAPIHLARSEPRDGLIGLAGERRELVVLHDTPAHTCRAGTFDGQRVSTFLGVPLIHHQRTLGVLAAWKMVPGHFDNDEMSFFVTLAPQLAKVIDEAANLAVVGKHLREGAGENAFIQGDRAAAGVAIGTVALVDPVAKLETIPDRPTVDPDSEAADFQAAVLAVQAELSASKARLSDVLPTEVHELFELYSMLLDDDRLVADTLERIRAGHWAPAAWRDTISEYARSFDRIEDPYLRARGADIRDLGMRVLMQLLPRREDPKRYPEHCILVGDAVSVQDIAAVPIHQLAGVVSRHGSTLSHAGVLANAMGVPAVVSLASIPVGLIDGLMVIVDGDEGRIYVNPSRDLLDAFELRIQEQKALSGQLVRYRHLPALTADGVRVHLYANIGLDSDIELASNSATEGVGLYRTEYQFLLRDAFPVEEEQCTIYRSLLERFAPKPVTIRTLDIGGDKVLTYFPLEDDNPFLGVRGIRFSLAHPEIFMIQLRALLRANAGPGNLQVLFPMIAKVSEVDATLDLLARAQRELLEEGQPAAKPRVGVMIEVPSAVFLTRALAERVDYLSIGTNDLSQYILAADRTNAQVTTPYDFLHPAVLHAISTTIRAARISGTPVHVCGEMAGDSAGALMLLGLGAEHLSMSPGAFGRVKRVIRAFTSKRARTLAAGALAQEGERQVLGLLDDALREAGILVRRPPAPDYAGFD